MHSKAGAGSTASVSPSKLQLVGLTCIRHSVTRHPETVKTYNSGICLLRDSIGYLNPLSRHHGKDRATELPDELLAVCFSANGHPAEHGPKI